MFAQDQTDVTHPGYISGAFYNAVPGVLPSTTTMVVVAGTIYAQPLILPRRATIGGLVANVTTGAVGAMRMGIYRTTAAVPTALVAEAAVTADTNSTSTFNPLFATAQTLERGVYWIVSLFSGTPTLTRFGGSPNAFGGFSYWIGTGTAASLYSTAADRTGGYTVSFAYAALPAAFGTPAAAVSTPLMGWSHA